MVDNKVRENRLRRMAERQGLRLRKSRRRDPRAIEFGGYMLGNDKGIVLGEGADRRYAATLGEVEAYLLDNGKKRR